VPTPSRFQGGGSQLPLLQWVLNTCLEAPGLFLVANLEPEFDQLDPGVNKPRLLTYPRCPFHASFAKV